MSLDGLSLSFLVKELNTLLTGSRIDKIFQIDKYSLLLWLRLPGENVKLMISANPERPSIYLTESVPENPAAPPSFCMLLRKHLEDGRIAGIEQYNLDRILSVNIDIRGEKGMIVTKTLIIELMGKHSNIIFVQDQSIIDAIRRVGSNISRYRQVLPGKEYIYPPSLGVRYNILTTPADRFVKRLSEYEKNTLLKAVINTGDGFGPVTAKEIIYRANLQAETPISELTSAAYIHLENAVKSIVNPLNNNVVNPTVILNHSKKLLAIAAFPVTHITNQDVHQFSTMNQLVEFISSVKSIFQIPEKDYLTKFTASELSKLNKKKLVLIEELREANNAERLRKYGDILMASMYQISKGESEVTLPDIFAEQPDLAKITITLDPKYTPLENAQNYYTKYNKLKRAQNLLLEQIKECTQEVEYLETVAVSLDNVLNSNDTLDIKQELTAAGYIKENNKRKFKNQYISKPMTVASPDGLSIIIGKNNRQNDMVTFKEGRADDIWFHTKDIPGSHVILKCYSGEPPQASLLAAAQLAAYFSKARQSSNVPVDYTKRRYVKKPSGAKPGFVIYEHQTTLYVTPDESLIKQWLQ